MGQAAMRCNAVWVAERMSPSPIDGAKRNNRATVEVIAVLSVHVERPVAHALADGPHVVEAGDVHAVSGNNLGVSKSQIQRASRSIAIRRKQIKRIKSVSRCGEINYHAKLGSCQGPILCLVARFPGAHHPVGCRNQRSSIISHCRAQFFWATSQVERTTF